jgi:hypothetical protein
MRERETFIQHAHACSVGSTLIAQHILLLQQVPAFLCTQKSVQPTNNVHTGNNYRACLIFFFVNFHYYDVLSTTWLFTYLLFHIHINIYIYILMGRMGTDGWILLYSDEPTCIFCVV